MGPFAIFAMFAGLVGLYIFRFRIGVPSRSSLLPFQRGLLYRRGLPVREVGPGRHWVFLGREKIIFLDARPILVKVEHRAVSLTDGATALYGIAASAEVRDVRKALYSSTNCSRLPAFVTLCVAREVLGRRRAEEIRLGQAALTEEIFAACQSRLAAAGFDLLSFRFSNLSVVAHLE